MANMAEALNLYQLIRMGLSSMGGDNKEDAQARLSARLSQQDQFGIPFEVTDQDRSDYSTVTGGVQWPKDPNTLREVINANINPESGMAVMGDEYDNDWAVPLSAEQIARKKAMSEANAQLGAEDYRQQQLEKRMPTGQGAPTIADIFASVRNVTRQKPNAPQPVKTWNLPGGGTTNLPTGTMPPAGAVPWSKPTEKTPQLDPLTKFSRQVHGDVRRLFGENEMSSLDEKLIPKVNQVTQLTMKYFEQELQQNPMMAYPNAIQKAYQEVTGQQASLDRIPGRQEKLLGNEASNMEDAKASVKISRSQGVTDEQIQQSLLDKGWKPDEVLTIMGKEQPAAPSSWPSETAPGSTAPQTEVSDQEAQDRYNRFRMKGYSPDEAAAMAYGK